MMDKLLARAARIAAVRVTEIADRLAEAAKTDLPPDVNVTREGDTIFIEGKALARRALTEVALRGLAALAKAILK